MYHEECENHRRDLYALWKEFNLVGTVEIVGDPEEMIRAEKILEKGTVKLKWMGPGENKDTFDIVLIIPSLSSDGCHEIAGKLKKIDGNEYWLTEILSKCLDHSCKETIYRRQVGRLPGPDHHEIAFYRALQQYLPLWCHSKKHEIKKVPKIYNKVPRDVINLYDALTKKRIGALERKEIVYNYLRKVGHHKFEHGQLMLDKWIK